MGQAVSDETPIHPAISPGQLRRLYQVSKVIHSTLDQQEALDLIVREAVGLVNATSGSVVLINPIDGFLEIQAAHGLSAGAKLKLRVGEGITGWVAQQGKSAIVPDVSADKRYVPVHEHTGRNSPSRWKSTAYSAGLSTWTPTSQAPSTKTTSRC